MFVLVVKDKCDEELNIVADFYKDDINKEQLKMSGSHWSLGVIKNGSQ